MSDSFWQSSGSTDFGSSPNWTAGVPASAGQVGIFDGRSQVSVKTGLNRGAVSFDLVTRKEYTGSIGNPGDPLIWNGPSLRNTVIRGTGRCEFQGSALGGDYIVDSENLIDALTVRGSAINRIFVKRGHVIVASDGDWSGTSDQLILDGPFAICTVESKVGPAGPDEIIMVAGRLNWKRGMASSTLIIQKSGTIDWTGALASSGQLIQTDGRFRYAPSPLSVAVMGAYVDGVLDLSANSEPSWTADITVGPNGTVLPELSNPGFAPQLDLRLEYP